MDEESLRKIRALRQELHQRAELSGQERETKTFLMDFMRKHTDFEVVDRGSWFYCRKDPQGRDPQGSAVPIAFRADMDALPIEESLPLPYASRCPGVSHKCGHDGHSAALAGLGLSLAGKELNRPVVLIFQHAEETGKGGETCAALIDELHIGEVYAFHNLSGYPEGSIVVRDNLTQPASKGLTVHFHGKASHASNPEQGSNPSDAVCDLEASIREALRAPHRGMVLCTVVNISVGTRDFGVSAGEGEISMTLRAENEPEMDELEAAIRKKARELASRDGLSVSFREEDPFPETRNDPQALDKVVACAEELGYPVVHMKELWRASEDFGWYLKRCRGAIFYVGNGEEYAPLHTREYDFNDRILGRAVSMFCALAAAAALGGERSDECHGQQKGEKEHA